MNKQLHRVVVYLPISKGLVQGTQGFFTEEIVTLYIICIVFCQCSVNIIHKMHRQEVPGICPQATKQYA